MHLYIIFFADINLFILSFAVEIATNYFFCDINNAMYSYRFVGVCFGPKNATVSDEKSVE